MDFCYEQGTAGTVGDGANDHPPYELASFLGGVRTLLEAEAEPNPKITNPQNAKQQEHNAMHTLFEHVQTTRIRNANANAEHGEPNIK